MAWMLILTATRGCVKIIYSTILSRCVLAPIGRQLRLLLMLPLLLLLRKKRKLRLLLLHKLPCLCLCLHLY